MEFAISRAAINIAGDAYSIARARDEPLFRPLVYLFQLHRGQRWKNVFLFRADNNTERLAMKYLTQEQADHLALLLEERERELREDIERESGIKDNFIDIATEINDPGRSSFANLAVDLGHAAVSRDINELRAIDGARGRIKDGSYGECTECHTAIPYERLLVQPTAERCAPCQDMYEKTHANAQGGPRM